MAPDETAKPSPCVPRLRPAPVARVPFEYLGLLRLDELGYVGVVGDPGAPAYREPWQTPTGGSTVSLRGRGSGRKG